MIYTEDWAFIHIPKTSGINLKRNAEIALGDEVFKPYENTALGRVIGHNPYSYWEDQIEDKWGFAIIRNPYERAVSAWLYLKTSSLLKQLPEKYNNLNLYQFYTLMPDRFTQFKNVEWGARTTQLSFIKNRAGKVSCETFRMEDQLTILETKLGFKFTHTKHNAMPSYNYNDCLDSRSKLVIEQVFREDFEYFGYRRQ